MSSTRRRFHVRRPPVVVDIGCSCRRSKLSSFFSPSSSKKTPKYTPVFSPSTASLTTTTTATTALSSSSFSPSNYATSSPSPKQSAKQGRTAATKMNKKKKKAAALAEESVAVEKESSDPYLDFRDSMLQMIVEKEIYGWDDLRELLHLFLSLNSPHHHHLILQAFAEIWNAVLSPPA